MDRLPPTAVGGLFTGAGVRSAAGVMAGYLFGPGKSSRTARPIADAVGRPSRGSIEVRENGLGKKFPMGPVA